MKSTPFIELATGDVVVEPKPEFFLGAWTGAMNAMGQDEYDSKLGLRFRSFIPIFCSRKSWADGFIRYCFYLN